MALLLRLFFLAPILFMVSCTVSAPPGKLIHDKLRSCPEKPNCVSSENGIPEENHVPPLPYTGDPAVAWQQLQDIVADMNGEILSVEEQYIWVIFRSKFFKFIDDLECRLNKADKVIHLRSGARTGFTDLGVNRKRVQVITKKFEILQKSKVQN